MALFDTRDHVKFPYRFMDFASDLTDAEMGRMVDAIIRYCKNETLPDFTGRCWDVFMWMKRIIDYQEEHPNWRGGDIDNPQRDRNSPEYRMWRNAVFLRDNYTCQVCGQVGGRINAHHIKRFSKYPSLRFVLGNGITLCEKCHKAVHKGGGESAQQDHKGINQTQSGD